jgi:hypothetical protein
MSKPGVHIVIKLSCSAATVLLASATLILPGALQAQSENLATPIANIKTFFQQLDELAEGCLDNDAAYCQAFSESLDQQLGVYLTACEPLIAWRDALVEQNTTTPVTADSTTTQQLLDVEFTCGENALVKQTDYVQQAFSKIQTALEPVSASSVATLAASQNQQRASEQQARMRQSLLGGVQDQNQRLNSEIELQWRRIELDNLREQNRRPLDFGTFPLSTGN